MQVAPQPATLLLDGRDVCSVILQVRRQRARPQRLRQQRSDERGRAVAGREGDLPGAQPDLQLDGASLAEGRVRTSVVGHSRAGRDHGHLAVDPQRGLRQHEGLPDRPQGDDRIVADAPRNQAGGVERVRSVAEQELFHDAAEQHAASGGRRPASTPANRPSTATSGRSVAELLDAERPRRRRARDR